MKTINKSFKVRIYPNVKQQIQINKTLGCCRFLYNQMLNERIETYKKLKEDKRALYEYKYKTELDYKKEYEWMKEADATALQQSRINLSKAYQNFFRSVKNRDNVGFPKFKKKKLASSYRTRLYDNSSMDFKNRKICFFKLGEVYYRDSRYASKGIPKSVTISRTSTGKYFASILFEQQIEEVKKVNVEQLPKAKVIGLDMSLDKFFVDDKGNSPVYERLYRKNEKKLKRLNRWLARKQKGSKNRKKQIRKLSLVHEQISNKRNDFTQKLSTQLVKEKDVIVVENLSLQGMSQGLKLGKSIHDLGYSNFINQLKYKCDWYGKILIEADKWFASSKTCSKCGFIYKNLQLSDRVFNCPKCGNTIDRDMNAGINLKNLAVLRMDHPEVTLAEKLGS